ncbi:Cobalt-precorrin-8 methylmutase [Acaryochloris thomasi RCC1774]|uniref:Cobalt-precorrin-8 methylmutase n=1 Tax=Acaryochloris thomasi RCC1774 TaxID=1764569 RepID=A0A2W1JPX3_9CYAN|nr:cobalt-precorrin-8X methylmutase [Acaryochloris thomasi]PZD75306.1 Cobalt-precorrin-8 methylmutase [Acaryochloris thomasi RCC1774]
MSPTVHPILQQSFAVIDQEMGHHSFSADEYAVVRRVIHSTADFEFQHLLQFSSGVIEDAIATLTQGTPIITDVEMVARGIQRLVQDTFGNPIIAAVSTASMAAPGQTRTETGLLQCLQQYPTGIYVIGNAPTALLALCRHLKTASQSPSLVIGAPVGFISVVESKAALAQQAVPQIRTEGRKGGSPAASAIINALIMLAWDRQSPRSL